jgi:hypothetical protein
MKRETTVIVPDVLAITHCMKMKSLYYFSMGEILDKDIFQSNNEKIIFDIRIVGNPEEYIEDKYEQFSTYFKVSDEDIFYEREYIGLKCKMLIKGIRSNKIIVYVNQTYLFFVKFKMDNLYPVGVHLMDVFLLNIISKGNLVVHAASLYNPRTDDAFLIIAPPDTGKTYSTAMLIRNGYKFIGEDLSYYDLKTDSLMCVPYTSTWGHHFTNKRFSLAQIPIVNWFFIGKKEIVTDIFGKDSIIKRAKLSRIYLIEKASENSIKRVVFNNEFLRKLIIIQRNEFTYFKNMLLRAFEYINNTNIDGIMRKEDESLERLLKTKELFVVKGKGHDDFYKLIIENEKGYINK